MRAPWEASVDPGGTARRAAVLGRVLAPWRWRIGTWAGGYTVTGSSGALAPATDVDVLITRADAARPGDLARWLATGPVGGLTLAEAVVRVAVSARVLRADHELVGPGSRRVVTTSGGTTVTVVPDVARGWAVRSHGRRSPDGAPPVASVS